ncbi:MAG TPA: hypothetical protein VHL79_05295 [Ramlibacter sp.]|nr:hypothetical protein [Ramlibacter sp.]
MHPFIITAALVVVAPWAHGQAVYRCGSSYSQQPCPGGTTVQVDDARTPAEAARANSVAAADRKRADAMEKARLAQEKNAPKALVIGPAQAAASAPVVKVVARDDKKKKKGKQPEHFTAVAPKKKP